jgi:hypothetical protein
MGLLSLVKNFRAPALPLATKEYNEQATNQMANILRLYFNQLDQLIGQIVATIIPTGTEADPLYVGTYDSRGRLHVTNPQTIFFNTFQFGLETDVWETSTVSGGTATFEAATSSIQMAVTSTTNSECIRQTLIVQRYIPGRPSSLAFSVRLQTPVVGIRRRFGLFDGNNGFFFEDDGGVYSCVIVSNTSGSTVYNRVTRANWNGDKLDGTGASGITADPAAIQLINVQYEWYGAGQVIFQFIIDGNPITVQTFSSANLQTTPWCRTPFLPIRLEIKNTTGAAGTHYLWQGSNSLISDGSTVKLGIGQNILTPLAGIRAAAANTFYPVVSIRLKSTALQGVVLPTSFQVATLDNANIFFKIIRNATVNGTWVDMPDANSFAQYNYTSTGAITNGTDLFSGFIPNSSGGVVNKLDPDTVYQIGRSSLGTVSDTITLAAAATATNKDMVGSLTWIEQR